MLRAGKAAGAALRTAAAQGPRGFASGNEKITATLFTGDGIGPEICEAVKKVSDDVLPCCTTTSRLHCKGQHAADTVASAQSRSTWPSQAERKEEQLITI